MDYPVRRPLQEDLRFYVPHSIIAPKNILAECSRQDTTTNVLFLDCKDMLHIFSTIFHSKDNGNLLIYVNSASGLTIARNIVMLKIIEDFDPENVDDIIFLCDVWYNTQWSETTKNRFLRNIQELTNDKLPRNCNIHGDDKIIKNIWNCWASSVVNMTAELKNSILIERCNSLVECWTRKHSKLETKQDENNLPNSFTYVVDQLISHSECSVGIPDTLDALRDVFLTEVGNYFISGNCEVSTERKDSINPTFLEPATNRWFADHSVCPLDAYIPSLVSTSHNLATQIESATDFCLEIVKNLVKTFQQQQGNISLFFHLGDGLQFCYEYQADKFHAIDCSDLVDRLGMINVINATEPMLAEDTESVIVMESTTWQNMAPSLQEFIENSLCTTLSMVPTLYGLRLADQVALGNVIPFKMHQVASVPVTLKWQRALRYSKTKLCLSPPITNFWKELESRCFSIKAAGPASIVKFYTPVTLFYCMLSLAERIVWQDPWQPQLARPFALSWQTFQAGCGDGGLGQISTTLSYVSSFSEIDSSANLRLVFIDTDKVPTSLCLEELYRRISEDYLADVHYIDNVQVSCKVQEIQQVTVSFFMAADRVPAVPVNVYLLDLTCRRVICNGLCKLLQIQQSPLMQSSRIFRAPLSLRRGRLLPGVDVDMEACTEYEDHYVVDIYVPKNGRLGGFKLLAKEESRCESGHEMTLTLYNGNGEIRRIDFIYPWPVKVNGLKITLDQELQSVRVVARKLIYEPWPREFNHVPKWDVDRLINWDSIYSHKELSVHLSAQFCFRDLHSQALGIEDESNTTALNEVRQIIRTLFVESLINGHHYFIIRDKTNCEKIPDWYLRVHLPILFSPLGNPMLVISANDHQMARKLIDFGKLDKSQGMVDFEKVFARESLSEIVTVFTDTEEEAALLRYVLRLNSSKMKPNCWQSGYLPCGKDSPWLSTFLSPLYVDHPGSLSDMKSFLQVQSHGRENKSSPTEQICVTDDFDQSCTYCNVRTNVRKCSRCKIAKYCSVKCQRSHWPRHKMNCS